MTPPVLPASAVPVGTAGACGTTPSVMGPAGTSRPFVSVDMRRAGSIRAASSAAGPVGSYRLRHTDSTGENT